MNYTTESLYATVSQMMLTVNLGLNIPLRPVTEEELAYFRKRWSAEGRPKESPKAKLAGAVVLDEQYILAVDQEEGVDDYIFTIVRDAGAKTWRNAFTIREMDDSPESLAEGFALIVQQMILERLDPRRDA